MIKINSVEQDLVNKAERVPEEKEVKLWKVKKARYKAEALLRAEKEKNKLMIFNMVKEGIDPVVISRITGLSIRELFQLITDGFVA